MIGLVKVKWTWNWGEPLVAIGRFWCHSRHAVSQKHTLHHITARPMKMGVSLCTAGFLRQPYNTRESQALEWAGEIRFCCSWVQKSGASLLRNQKSLQLHFMQCWGRRTRFTLHRQLERRTQKGRVQWEKKGGKLLWPWCGFLFTLINHTEPKRGYKSSSWSPAPMKRLFLTCTFSLFLILLFFFFKSLWRKNAV